MEIYIIFNLIGGYTENPLFTFITFLFIQLTSTAQEGWLQQESGTAAHLREVVFINADTGWIAGKNGTILHTTNGGVSLVEEEEIDRIPSDYSLSQNYPNPFNPATKIKYSIPQSSNVTIRLFDILGYEIETLVNEEKPAGTYEIEFNSHSGNFRNLPAGRQGLPSGVYFYQLKSDSFIETKKMVLLK